MEEMLEIYILLFIPIGILLGIFGENAVAIWLVAPMIAVASWIACSILLMVTHLSDVYLVGYPLFILIAVFINFFIRAFTSPSSGDTKFHYKYLVVDRDSPIWPPSPNPYLNKIIYFKYDLKYATRMAYHQTIDIIYYSIRSLYLSVKWNLGTGDGGKYFELDGEYKGRVLRPDDVNHCCAVVEMVLASLAKRRELDHLFYSIIIMLAYGIFLIYAVTVGDLQEPIGFYMFKYLPAHMSHHEKGYKLLIGTICLLGVMFSMTKFLLRFGAGRNLEFNIIRRLVRYADECNKTIGFSVGENGITCKVFDRFPEQGLCIKSANTYYVCLAGSLNFKTMQFYCKLLHIEGFRRLLKLQVLSAESATSGTDPNIQ